jgi:RNA polymerase sigma-70 factor (ECF subfamily)
MAGEENGAEARSLAGAVARRSYGKLLAFLAASTGDVTAAEDALADAFAAALVAWPGRGCPAKPEAWLVTVARRKIIDEARRRRFGEAAGDHLQVIVEHLESAAAGGEIPDRRLALLFAAAHPAVEPGISAPLMLQTVLGFDARMIASAFLTSPDAMAKRLMRAKSKIKQAGIPFSVPDRDELPGRLDAVLSAIYAVFAEGWADPAGIDVARRGFTGEALFLARLVVELMAGEPEALGLLALMLHAEARRPARRNADGEFVPLSQQDTKVWDTGMITEAETLLRRASAADAIGRYQLEAALQSAHVHRCRTGEDNWGHVVSIYDALLEVSGSPVVRLNRALAVAETQGPHAALAELEALSTDRRMAEYQPYWAARAELLGKSGAYREARQCYDVGIGLERDSAVRAFLQRRQSALPE